MRSLSLPSSLRSGLLVAGGLLALMASGGAAGCGAADRANNGGTGGAGDAGSGGAAAGTGGVGSGGAVATGSGGALAPGSGGSGTGGQTGSGGTIGGTGGAGSGGAAAGSGGTAPMGSGGTSTGGRGGQAGAPAGAGGTAGQGGPPMHRELLLYDDGGRLLYVNNVNPAMNWTVTSGGGRDLQLIGGGRVLLGKGDGWDEYRISDGMMVGGRHGFSGVQCVNRLADGTTMLGTVSGTSIVLRMVDVSGQVTRTITYPNHDYVRLVRQMANGNFLVAAQMVVFEGDPQGREVWSVNVAGGRNVWKAMRMKDGRTVVATGYGANLQIYNAAGTMVQTIAGPAAIAPWFYADFHVMPNGNYFVVNSQADRTNNASIQLVEYSPAGALVWQQKQPAGVRSLEAAFVLDGLDLSKLHVEPEGVVVPVP